MQPNEALPSVLETTPGRDYDIRILDCNSITQARLSLHRAALNIKYGPNGIGKSTIARALRLNAAEDGALSELLPFKYRDTATPPEPRVEGAEDIKKVLVFDDSYVSQFVFQPDEVLKDSFEIFINTEEYKQGIKDISSLFSELQDTFSNEADLEEAIVAFTELRDAFGITKSGVIAKTSRGFKALGMVPKLTNIPAPLQGYKGFLHGSDPAGWISWQAKGKAFLEMSDNCPFCSTVDVDKETAKQVSTEYESAAVKALAGLRVVVERLGEYFVESDRMLLQDILTSAVSELSLEQGQFLATLRAQIQTLLTKLSALRALSFHALRDEKSVDERLRALKIDLNLLGSLKSEATQSVIQPINEKIDGVASKINLIRERIGKQKKRVSELIKSNQDGINDFLASAGYRYGVRIEPSSDSYKMILEHKDSSGHIPSASSHLSYGEKNAFALVLFMHHVRREQPDLVVLDDPVSSFDKTKKFAILHHLFHGRNSIRDQTTLFLTHDIEPAIDIVRTATRNQFAAAKPAAYFLSARSGVVTEKAIGRSDIATFSQICDENIKGSRDILIKSIYLRRLYEVHGDLGLEYEMLSSLVHARSVPDRKAHGDGSRVPLSVEELAAATSSIQRDIPGFNYDIAVAELQDFGGLKAKYDATEIGYEKVQIFRVLAELEPERLKTGSAFQKFLNESYHIENEYVMQLNPREFDAVPEYVTEACSELLEDVIRSPK
jgi:energy-coupling factor transporter ATP-binding protein EcfA2